MKLHTAPQSQCNFECMEMLCDCVYFASVHLGQFGVWLASGNLVMYSYRLRMGPGTKPMAGKDPVAFLGSFFVNRLRLHTEITFWEFDQVLLCAQPVHLQQ